jgi:hypothetical protein
MRQPRPLGELFVWAAQHPWGSSLSVGAGHGMAQAFVERNLTIFKGWGYEFG